MISIFIALASMVSSRWTGPSDRRVVVLAPLVGLPAHAEARPVARGHDYRWRSLALLGPFSLLMVAAGGCQPLPSTKSPSPLDKIAFDLSQLDEQGLYGPTGGKRALDYEFCIPTGQTYQAAVSAIDPSLQLFAGIPGRIGCTEQQILAIGNTHQPRAQLVLQELANLDYIDRIVRVDWE